MLALVRSKFDWSILSQDVNKWCEEYPSCFVVNESVPKVKASMCHLLCSKPLDTISIDFTLKSHRQVWRMF